MTLALHQQVDDRTIRLSKEECTLVIWGYRGIMEKKMETIGILGFI